MHLYQLMLLEKAGNRLIKINKEKVVNDFNERCIKDVILVLMANNYHLYKNRHITTDSLLRTQPLCPHTDQRELKLMKYIVQSCFSVSTKRRKKKQNPVKHFFITQITKETNRKLIIVQLARFKNS